MSEPSVSTILRGALSALDERGHHKGSSVGADGSVCMTQAIKVSMRDLGLYSRFGDRPRMIKDWDVLAAALRSMAAELFGDRFTRHLPHGVAVPDYVGDLASFNDDPTTTTEDVKVLIEKTAIKMEEMA